MCVCVCIVSHCTHTSTPLIPSNFCCWCSFLFLSMRIARARSHEIHHTFILFLFRWVREKKKPATIAQRVFVSWLPNRGHRRCHHQQVNIIFTCTLALVRQSFCTFKWLQDISQTTDKSKHNKNPPHLSPATPASPANFPLLYTYTERDTDTDTYTSFGWLLKFVVAKWVYIPPLIRRLEGFIC